MIALMDDGIGNLRSVRKAMEHIGAEVTRTSGPEVIVAADKGVLPGVGACGDGMQEMKGFP
jgi:imidazole glycerol-phosphate synthase subunit HisH